MYRGKVTMVSGDEPQLGGQSDDNSPMISGRGTKIIADARGAYLAGNIEELIKQLTTEQQLRLRRIVVRHALDHVYRAYQPDIEHLRWIQLQREVLDLVEQWLNTVSTQLYEQIQELAEYVYPTDDSPMILYQLLRAVTFPAEKTCGYARNVHLLLPLYEASSYWFASDHLIAQWHLDTAWAISIHKTTPQAPSLEYKEVSVIVQDARRMYEQQNLDALIELMNQSQQTHFRRLVLEQMVLQLEHLILGEVAAPHHLEILQIMKRWSVDSNSDHYAAEWLNIWNSLNIEIREYSHGDIELVIQDALAVFDPLRNQVKVAWYAERIRQTVIRRRVLRGESIPKLTIHKSAAWQLEAAWAILNDLDIPPLE